MALGSAYDSQIIKALLTPMTATRLGHEIKVDDGALTVHLINELLKEGFVEVVGADGANPIWGLTDKGREARTKLD